MLALLTYINLVNQAMPIRTLVDSSRTRHGVGTTLVGRSVREIWATATYPQAFAGGASHA